jgi:hypothetical protein
MAQLLVTVCNDCTRVALRAFDQTSGAAATCDRCHGRLQVVPSCSYGASDAALFEELSAAVGPELRSLEAQRFVSAVNGALASGAIFESFQALGDRWPNLLPLVLVIGKNQTQQRRVLSMLKTIFEAKATTSRSGVRPAVELPADTDQRAKSSGRD